MWELDKYESYTVWVILCKNEREVTDPKSLILPSAQNLETKRYIRHGWNIYVEIAFFETILSQQHTCYYNHPIQAT
jgi:hypothetical protein